MKITPTNIKREITKTLEDIARCKNLMAQYPDLQLDERYDELWTKCDLLAKELEGYGN